MNKYKLFLSSVTNNQKPYLTDQKIQSSQAAKFL
ncbi:hypothetical protein QF004_002734 [Chryseobacterium sp. MDT2-18]|nr:hypothetical protein [Chryseobacterium sp. MDT2-18]